MHDPHDPAIVLRAFGVRIVAVKAIVADWPSKGKSALVFDYTFTGPFLPVEHDLLSIKKGKILNRLRIIPRPRCVHGCYEEQCFLAYLTRKWRGLP